MRFGDLSIHNGLMMRSNRIVIPKDLQQEVLLQLHSGHQGIHKCKERARCSVWWPGINMDIEEYIKKCRVCCQFQRPRFEPLCPSELPDTPWQKVGTDLFEWKQVSYLLVMDYYSRFIEIAKLSSTTSRGVINHLKSIFARHGIPQIVVSDNGPQYSSSEFAQFARDYKFNHITSSPHFPQANGESERAVQTVKGLLKRSNDPYLALLAYRSTPLKLGYSPAELLMGRALRTTVPIPLEQLQPKLLNNNKLKKKDKELKIKQKENYDNRHKTSERDILEPGDEVWIYDQGVSGEVTNERGPRSYQVQTSTGVVRRNRRDLNRLPSQDVHSSGDETPPITQFSTSGDTSSQLRRNLRQSKPPDRYGVWLNSVHQNWGEM